MNEPDWTELEAIGNELTAELKQGTLDRAKFDALWDRAVEAVNGHNEFLEFLVNHAQEDWLDG